MSANVRIGLVTDSGGVEKLPMPRAAGAVWPTTVSGKLGAGTMKTKAREGGAAMRPMPIRMDRNPVR